MEIKNVNVLELARGAIIEQIESEMLNITTNILDPNTDAKKTRKLTITLTFKSDADRSTVALEAQAKSSLAPIVPIATRLLVGADKDGVPRATELTRDDPNQVHIFEDEEPAQNVVNMRRVN